MGRNGRPCEVERLEQSRPQRLTAPSEPTAPGNTNAPASLDEEVIVLDPFTVVTEHEGYKADDTLAGGRVRTQLRDTPSSLSVVTKKFLTDLNINNQEDLFVYTANTEVAGLYGNYSGMSTRGQGIAGGAEATRLVNPAGVRRRILELLLSGEQTSGAVVDVVNREFGIC